MSDADARAIEHTVRALDDARYAAMREGDLALLTGLLSERLTYTHSTGVTETRAQYLEALASGRVRYLRTEREIAHFSAWPHCAVMQGRLRVQAQVDGRPFAGRTRFTSTWVAQDGRWTLAAWAATPEPQEAS